MTEARVIGKVREPDRAAEPPPIGFADHGDHEPFSVRAHERLVGTGVVPGRQLHVTRGAHHPVALGGDQRFQQRDFDELPQAAVSLAGEQGRQDRLDGQARGIGVGNGDHHELGMIAVPLTMHDAGHRLQDDVERRSVPEDSLPAESRNRAIHQSGVGAGGRLVVDAELGGHPWPEVLYQHIGTPDQALSRLSTIGKLQVEDDATLATVQGHEIHPLAAEKGWPESPGVIADRGLHFHDLGSQVRQHHRAVRPGEKAREVDHTDALQGRRRLRVGGGARRRHRDLAASTRARYMPRPLRCSSICSGCQSTPMMKAADGSSRPSI